MAKLILTKEEKESESFLDFSDESLGKVTKNVAYSIRDKFGSKAIALTSTWAFCCAEMQRMNAGELTITAIGLQKKDGEQLGDWEMRIKKIEKQEG